MTEQVRNPVARLFPFAFCLTWALGLGPWAFPFAQQPARDTPLRPPPPTGSGIIAGVLLTDDTPPQPVRKARVMLNEVERAILGRTVTTDDSGRFEFQDLPAGRFELWASKPGHNEVRYGAKRSGRPGTPISLSASQKVVDLVLRMSRGGAITGVVRDQSGQPVPAVSVNVLQYGYSPTSGARSLGMRTMSSYASTDDRGIYRAWGLPPGGYVVVVTPGSAQGVLPGGRSSQGLDQLHLLTRAEVQRAMSLAKTGGTGEGVSTTGRGRTPLVPPRAPVNFAPVFHPGTTNVAHASTVTLGVAEERTGVDVQLQLVQTARIEGSCVLPPGVQPQTISVTLTPAGSAVEVQQGFGLPAVRSTRLNLAGQFAFVGITPGLYNVTAKSEPPASGPPGGRGGPGGPPIREASSAPSWYAHAEIDVDGRDLSVPLELQPSMSVVGRVVFEGAAPPPQDLSGIQLRLVPRGAAGNLGASPPGGQVDQQGNFRFSDVTPDSYRLLSMGSGATRMPGWSRKSADAIGVDLFDVPLDVKPGMGTIALTITYTDRPTEIGGTLQDATGRPAADYFIVVFSTSRTLWGPQTRRVQTTRPATDGGYSFQLPAGEYFIAALTDFQPGDSNDPAFLEQLIPGAIKIAVADGEKKRQDFRIAGR